MKKIILITILSFLLLSFGVQVSAQEADLPSPGLLPDSPFYFLEIIAEGIGTFFTFGDLKKAERCAVLAAERLAEAKAVVEKGKPEFAEKTLARYKNQLNNSMVQAEKAMAEGKDTEKVIEVLTKVGKATSRHLEVLIEVREKVPEQAKQAIKMAIENAIEKAMVVSLKGHEKAVEALKARDALGEVPEEVLLPVQVPQEVRERIQTSVQQELEAEKAERAKENDIQSFEWFRAFCIEQGAQSEMCTSFVNDLQRSESIRAFCLEKGMLPAEMCEKIPFQGFKSFKELEVFCIETGGTPEICSSVEARCGEVGVTTPDECFFVLLTATVTTKAAPAPSLSEEEMRQERTEVMSFEELEAKCLEETRISPEQCALIEAKCKEAGAATADECDRGEDSEGNLIQPLKFSP